MLTLREKIIVLYSTAPEGFAATSRELRHKFDAHGSKVNSLFTRLVARGILIRAESGKYIAGPAIHEELGDLE